MTEFKIIQTLADVAPTDWDRLVGPTGCPFLEYAFLYGLEASGCVGPGTGWLSRHVVVYEGDILVAALPLYRKVDSYGEFIFDHAWADAAHRSGMPYYPKMVSASPFSPVAGSRMLIGEGDPAQLRSCLLAGARAAAENEPATGIHFLFINADEEAGLEEAELAIRHTHQFQWSNEGYACFDEFLGRFRSKRRNQIRRERRRVREAGVVMRSATGDALTPELLEIAWSLYCSTVDKYMWGRRYLNRAFFTYLFEHFSDRLVLLLAERDGEVLAGTINVVKDGVFYGRYWGAFKELDCLHFEVCCYAPIDYAIAQGLRRVEAGAGGGHKYGRGFLPVITRSAHEIYLPGLAEAVYRHVAYERQSLGEEIERLDGRLLHALPACDDGEPPPDTHEKGPV